MRKPKANGTWHIPKIHLKECKAQAGHTQLRYPDMTVLDKKTKQKGGGNITAQTNIHACVRKQTHTMATSSNLEANQNGHNGNIRKYSCTWTIESRDRNTQSNEIKHKCSQTAGQLKWDQPPQLHKSTKVWNQKQTPRKVYRKGNSKD